MRVPELMTETFAAGITALLGSVIRPDKDAFDDCALTATGQNTTTAAKAMDRRDSQQHPKLSRLDTMKPAHYLPGLVLPESFYYIYQECQGNGETDRGCKMKVARQILVNR